MEILEELQRCLPASILITDAESRRPYECDGLSAYRQIPAVVVLPETTEQVQQILRICHQTATPVVARGAGTGLSGGALPIEQGVVLSLARFNKILSIDEQNLTATVQPGVRNLAVSEAVSGLGLYYAPDPSSQIACTIGGNVAENSGGVHCLKYGLTVHNILAVEIITIEGEKLTLGGPSLDTPGLDLLALITGSEGLLGVITSVTLKLLPKPSQVSVMMVSFDSVEDAGNAVAAIISAGIVPAGLEMMDRLVIGAAEDFIHAGYPCDVEAILLCELDGGEAEVQAQIEQVSAILVAHQGRDVRVAESVGEKQRFWAGRKAAFPAIGRISPDYYCMDGTIPRKHLATVLQKIAEFSTQYGLPVGNVFHAGDGNLHPLIMFDANKEGDLHKAEQLGSDILRLCVAVGGTVTGEHGVGIEKLDQMCDQFNSVELEQFHAVKRAFDPEQLLNPGKAVPTLHRCAELGAMHVHNGELAFPELERF